MGHVPKGPAKITSWKKPPSQLSDRTQIEHVVASLLIGGQLKEDFHYTPYNTISYILPGRTQLISPLFLSVPQPRRGIKRKKSTKQTDVIDITDSE